MTLALNPFPEPAAPLPLNRWVAVSSLAAVPLAASGDMGRVVSCSRHHRRGSYAVGDAGASGNVLQLSPPAERIEIDG